MKDLIFDLFILGRYPIFLPAAKRHGHAELWVEKKLVMGILVFESLYLLFLVFFGSDFSNFLIFQKIQMRKLRNSNFQKTQIF